MTMTIDDRLRHDLPQIAEAIETTPRPPQPVETSRRTRRLVIGGLIGVATLSGGVAIAASLLQTTPAGTSAEPNGEPAEGVTPSYPTNQRGQTYGDPGNEILPDDYPDLLAVVATNGRHGFVERALLDEATGANVSSPEEAVEWQRRQDEQGGKTIYLPVYESDGNTVVGEFPVTTSRASQP